MLARPAGRAIYHRALRSGELIPQNEKTLRRSEGSVEPNHELWRAGNSFLRMRRKNQKTHTVQNKVKSSAVQERHQLTV